MVNMVKVQIFFVLFAVVLTASCKKPTSEPLPIPKVEMPTQAESQELAKGSNAFGFDLWAKLRSNQGNFTVSPASITTALSMTWAGAKGKTEEQMRGVLHLTGDRDKVAGQWGKLSLALQNPSRSLKLRIANRLFGEKSVKFKQDFIDLTGNAFAAPLEPLDFKTSPDPSRLLINGWVEKQTEARIKDLLPPKSIQQDTRLVLVNAIYFLADWQESFDKHMTRPAPFTVEGGAQKSVETMHMRHSFPMAHRDGVRVLEMPYKGGDAAMVFVLPDKVDGLSEVEDSLSVEKIETWRSALAPTRVLVGIPKFELKMTETLRLRKELEEMGMPAAFDDKQADFSGIALPDDPIVIADVFHKAFVKVDEKGTEAAAATAVPTFGGGVPSKPEEFLANHPFLFFILDKPSGLILFMGRVADPS